VSGYEIYKTELWPVFYISPDKGKNAFQIPQDKVQWLEQVEAEFAKAQDYLAGLVEGEQK
jgi:hypothetical protein